MILRSAAAVALAAYHLAMARNASAHWDDSEHNRRKGSFQQEEED